MQKNKMIIAFVVLLWSLRASAHAQAQTTAPASPLDSTPAVALQGDLDKEAAKARMTLRDPSLTSPARLNENKLQAILTANRTDTRAEIEIGFEREKKPGEETSNSQFRTSVKLGGPVSKDDKETELATLDGLADQVTLSFGMHYVQETPEAIRKRVAENIAKRLQDDPDLFVKQLGDAFSRENPGKTKSDVSTDDLSPRARRSLLRNLKGPGRFGSFFGNVEATYSAPTTFKFVDAATLSRHEESHDGWAATLSGGWLPVVSPMPFVAINYSYQESHESQGKRQICAPFGPPGALACDNFVVGAPGYQRRQLAQLELRKYFPKATAAIGLRLTRDIENSITGVELPLWILRDDAGLLNGGLAAGWRSDTKAWTLSAFVGSPFGSGK